MPFPYATPTAAGLIMCGVKTPLPLPIGLGLGEAAGRMPGGGPRGGVGLGLRACIAAKRAPAILADARFPPAAWPPLPANWPPIPACGNPGRGARNGLF
mmetsp:Transcript_76259/g.135013  ORF Transcript_76259/g.135013 Transcript_76259/m.135013 type:complete len:99 (-) Transcript_76259:379-675(-)